MNRFTSERFNSGESLVNFSHLEKIQTFKKFCSGEYLSHLQKIQFFRRFDCGHLLNISHICKDSDIQKIPLPENTILSLGQNLNIIFPLHATSLRLPFCLPHFVTPSVTFASLNLTSHHFTSPILSASLHTTSLRLLFFMHHFTALCATSLSIPSLSLPHFTPLHVASHFFSLASPHFTPLHFTFHFVRLTSLHFMPLHFASFYLPHFVPLHATSRYFHLTSRHFTSPPILSALLHATSHHLPFFLPHLMPLHSTSLHLPSFPLTSPHLISSIHPLRFACNASPKKYVNAQSSKHASQPASQPALRKIRIGESFEYLSHLQKIRTFKRFKFFPESFECFEYPANFTIFEKRFRYSKDSTLVNL